MKKGKNKSPVWRRGFYRKAFLHDIKCTKNKHVANVFDCNKREDETYLNFYYTVKIKNYNKKEEK
jgi:hypothetical protein